jgi:biopolymer transport protein ExbB/TolQ
MVALPGSEVLTGIFYVIAQSLLIPVLAALLISLLYAILQAGGIFSEYSSRITTSVNEIEKLLNDIAETGTPESIQEAVDKSNIPPSHKDIVAKVIANTNLDKVSNEAFARKLIEVEEVKAAKTLEKTDIIAKIGPAIGLMGTLIPMGPGLAALGAGDINTLAQNLMVAFDAAIIGLAAASVAFVISRIRRRWYEDRLANLDTITESVVEVLYNAKKKTTDIL